MFGGRKIRGGGIEEYMPSTGNYFDGASSWFGDMTNRAKSAAGISAPMAATPVYEPSAAPMAAAPMAAAPMAAATMDEPSAAPAEDFIGGRRYRKSRKGRKSRKHATKGKKRKSKGRGKRSRRSRRSRR